MNRTSRRSNQKKSAVWLLAWVLLGVVALGVVLVLAGRGMVVRMAAAKELDRAIQISRQADAAVLDVDKVVRAQVSSGTAETAAAARSEIPSATAALEQAVVIVDGAYNGLNDDEREQAAALREADKARIVLLKVAGPLLDENAALAEAVLLAEGAYAKLAAAEKGSDAAVRSYNKLTKAGVRESVKLNEAARSQLREARKGFAAAQEAMPGADLSAFIEYTDRRIEVVEVSLKSDRAYLSGSATTANELSSRFNKAEKAATAAAAKLPKSPSDPLAAAYDVRAKAAQEAYFKARDAVSAADKKLREQ